MLGLAALSLVALSAPTPTRSSSAQDGPDPAVLAARKELGEAFKQKDPTVRVQTITRHAAVEDEEVIEWFAKGLKDDADEVRGACIEALRYTGYPSALKELHSAWKRDKKLKEHEQLGPSLVKAIGQHANKDSIKLLAKDPLGTPKLQKLDKFRILSLGNIRQKESVAELMALMQKIGKGRILSFMGEFRMSLMILTGADRGENRDAWVEWWNDNRKTYEVAPEPPPLPKLMQKRWDYHWNIYRERERGERREKRGDDPEQ